MIITPFAKVSCGLPRGSADLRCGPADGFFAAAASWTRSRSL